MNLRTLACVALLIGCGAGLSGCRHGWHAVGRDLNTPAGAAALSSAGTTLELVYRFDLQLGKWIFGPAPEEKK